MATIVPSSTVALWTTAPCPITTPSPTTQGTPSSTCSTDPSWTLLPRPMRIGAMSPRMTALYQTLLPAPMVTSPMM